MRVLIGLWLAAVLSTAALAADNPDWASPVTPKPGSLDNTTPLTAIGSTKQYTAAQVDDAFIRPTGFRRIIPSMPEIVAHGGPKPAGRACDRKGPWVELMKAVVVKLDDADMIALAAYLESRNP